MSAPSLAEVLAAHRSIDDECVCGQFVWLEWSDWSGHVADVWRDACTVRSVEELRCAAQIGAVIRDRDGNTLVFDSWFVWLEPGGSDLTPVLPAVLLWHPSWES